MAQASNMLTLTKMMIVADIQPQRIPNPEATLLGMPVELRLQILGNLLPDVDFVPFKYTYERAKKLMQQNNVQRTACTECRQYPPAPMPYTSCPWQDDPLYFTKSPDTSLAVSTPDLRKDEGRCDVRIMRTCKQIYKECYRLIYTRDRVFEALLNWDTHSGGSHASISTLSYWRVKLPRPRTNSTLRPPPPLYSSHVDLEEYNGDLTAAVAPVSALQLALPIYRIVVGHRQIKSFKALVQRVVDLLLKRIANEEQPFLKLKVNIICDYPSRSSSNYRNSWTRNPSKSDQTQLKWILEPFVKIRDAHTVALSFQINGEETVNLEVQDRWPHLYQYTSFLCSAPYPDISKTESTNLPPHLHKLVELMKMQDSMTDLHEAALKVDDTSPPTTPPWNGPLPPPPPLDFLGPCSPRVTIWDAWETGDWAELHRQFQAVGDLWTETKDAMDPILEEVDEEFRKGGKKPV